MYLQLFVLHAAWYRNVLGLDHSLLMLDLYLDVHCQEKCMIQPLLPRLSPSCYCLFALCLNPGQGLLLGSADFDLGMSSISVGSDTEKRMTYSVAIRSNDHCATL